LADPFRFIYNGNAMRGRQSLSSPNMAQIVPNDAYQRAEYLISKHELALWFEPKWQTARLLARRFPHTMICSIPEESDTPNLYRVPGWRRRRHASGIL